MNDTTFNTITTYTGRNFNPLDPNIDDINLLDICHGLSNICRFVGHVREFYSVGEHSCRVHDLVSAPIRLRAILHDASEAYICDLAAPLKTQKEMEFFKVIENNLMKVIYEKYGLDEEEPEELHFFDKSLGSTEQRDLMPPGSVRGSYAPLENVFISPWSPVQAKFAMIDRLERLGLRVNK